MTDRTTMNGAGTKACVDCIHHRKGRCYEPRALNLWPEWQKPQEVDRVRSDSPITGKGSDATCGSAGKWFEAPPERQPSYGDPWYALLIFACLAVVVNIVKLYWNAHHHG